MITFMFEHHIYNLMILLMNITT